VPPQPRGPPGASPGPGVAPGRRPAPGRSRGAYIIPTFMDTLDAYTDKIAGYSHDKVGESLSGWDFEHFWLV